MSEPKPKIVHSQYREKLRLVNTALAHFSKQMAEKAEQMIRQGLFDGNPLRIACQDEIDLLFLRKQLAGYIKSGMIGREDQEREIAVLAMLIWANRKQSEGEKIFEIF